MKKVVPFILSFVFLTGCFCNRSHSYKSMSAEEKAIAEEIFPFETAPEQLLKSDPEPPTEPVSKKEMKDEEYKEKYVMSASKAVKEGMEDGEAYFAFGSFELTKTGREVIKEYANELNEKGYEEIRVEGHTDSVGRDEYNQKLSERRAETVKSELVKNGIDASKIKIIGYGKARPVADNRTKEGRAQNRRVEIIVK